MNCIPGTRGYEDVTDSFIEASQALDFAHINEDFLKFLPSPPARILDVGAGAGQNAAALARLGYSIYAIEPFVPFLNAAKCTYAELGINWSQDSLPLLGKLPNLAGYFDFILVDGVWHHLSEEERDRSLERFATLLTVGGAWPLSLRHGPAGAGKHIFQTDGPRTVTAATRYGLKVALHLQDEPSKMKNKPGVPWTRIVLTKTA